jgi:hypothetical protein
VAGEEEGAVDLMAQMEAAIAQLETDTDEGTEAVEPNNGQSTEVEPKTAQVDQKTVTAKETGDAATDVGTKPDPETERGLARLVAREAEIAAKEKEIQERQRSLGSVVSQLRRGQVAEAFKSLGLREDEIPKVVRVAMASQLPGDKVPEQYRRLQDELTLDDRFIEQRQEIETLRAELKREREEAAMQKARAEYEAGLDTFLGAPGDDLPVLAKLASANRTKARERIMAVVAADAQKKAAAYHAGQLKAEQAIPMSPAEAAKVVESELAEYAALFGATGNDNTNPTKTVVKGKPSLSNKATQPTASRQTSGDELTNLEDRVDEWLAANNL